MEHKGVCLSGSFSRLTAISGASSLGEAFLSKVIQEQVSNNLERVLELCVSSYGQSTINIKIRIMYRF